MYTAINKLWKLPSAFRPSLRVETMHAFGSRKNMSVENPQQKQNVLGPTRHL